ncbi:Chs7 protein [Saccharomycopsis crataegensis]|uniref:Chitin synthase export chaperone n=1 Tax=Saccharomycopsis crataegensis TaxID=43959 RepID=A0AAV5QQ43_9ASCO|nr:Chs7 protein [Saccharomycopsis crataegensis]
MTFGNMSEVCEHATVPLCNLISSGDDLFKTGVVPKCYARSIYVANTVIFQVGTTIINIGALILIVLILFNIRSKFTAIGRAEMMFLYSSLLVLTVFSIVNDCGVSPPGSRTYGFLVAVQNGLSSVCSWALMVCGFLGFELWEDGKKRSMMMLYVSSLGIFALTFILSVFAFRNLDSSVSVGRDTALFVVLYLLNAIFVAIYFVSQAILCLGILKNVWAFGVIALSSFFFVFAQILTYSLSKVICEGCNHYLDGLFFGTLSNTLAIMMIYKYWDIITAEDLEFSVSNGESFTQMFGSYDDKKSDLNYSDSRSNLNYPL